MPPPKTTRRRPGNRAAEAPAATLRRPSRDGGFVLTLALILVVTVVVLGSVAGLVALRNGLFKSAGANIVKESDGTVFAKPVDYGVCEEPSILCLDPATGFQPLVGVRATHFTTRNQIFYSGPGCTGDPFLAPPAVPAPAGIFPPALAVGYLNDALFLDGVGARFGYGVGAPRDWPCSPLDAAAVGACADGGLLYRTAGAAASTDVLSVWTSLAPDCSNTLLPGEVPSGPLPCPFTGEPGTVFDYDKISATAGGFSAALVAGGFPPLGTDDVFAGGMHSLGDLDGDGVTDLAITARRDDDGGTDRGAVYITFMNADGTVASVQKISNTFGGFAGVLDNGDFFGRSVATLGNLVDPALPGVLEIAVGAIFDDDGGADRGAVWILSLDTAGTVVGFQKISTTAGGFGGGLANDDRFGVAIENIGDLDGNGVPDLAVGAFLDDGPGTDRGAVWIAFLNADGTVSSKAQINHPDGGLTLGNGDWFGASITSLGDLVDPAMPGAIELAVAAPRDDDGGLDRGAVWIVSVDTAGAAVATQKISHGTGGFPVTELDNSDEFGNGLYRAGDIDGDSIPDLAVGSRLDDDGGADRGAVRILFLNADGTVKDLQKISALDGGFGGALDSGDFFGAEVTSIGDFNGDGFPDIGVGAIADDDGGIDVGAAWLLYLNGFLLPTECIPAPADLVSWWPGDGDAADIADGNPGTLLDGTTFAPATVLDGFLFDGVDDAVRVADAANLRTMTDITIDAWVRAEVTADSPIAGGDIDTVVRRDSAGLSIPRVLYDLDLVGGRLRLTFIGDGGGVTVATCLAATPGCIDVRDGDFHHLAVVRDTATGRARGYVDGIEVLDVPDVTTGDFDNGSDVPLWMGRFEALGDPPGFSRLLRGGVDEVQIFDRALTDCEIFFIYLAGPFGKCKAAELPPDDLCEEISATLTLAPAEEVLLDPMDAMSGNLLEPYSPLFSIMPSTLTFFPAGGEDAAVVVPPGPITDPGSELRFPEPAGEDAAPLAEDAPGPTDPGADPSFPAGGGGGRLTPIPPAGTSPPGARPATRPPTASARRAPARAKWAS